MNTIDILLTLIVGLSIVGGFMSGLSRLIVGFAATVVGIFLGFWFYGIVADPLLPYVSRPEIANAIGFLVILGASILAGSLVGRLLATMFKWVGLSWVDRLLGACAGFVRGIVVAVALMTIVLACVPSPPPQVLVDSRTMPYVIRAAALLAELTPHELKDAVIGTQSKIRDIWESSKPHRAPGREGKA